VLPPRMHSLRSIADVLARAVCESLWLLSDRFASYALFS
jgi:hypothetical protein